MGDTVTATSEAQALRVAASRCGLPARVRSLPRAETATPARGATERRESSTVGQRPARPNTVRANSHDITSRDHENESMEAFRFKTVVGPGFHDRRFLGHARSTLPTLYRTHGPNQEHGALLCALDRNDLVRHFLFDPAMGPHRFQRTINRTALRRGNGGRRYVSRSPMPETGPRLQSEDDQASTHLLTNATAGAALQAGYMGKGRAVH